MKKLKIILLGLLFTSVLFSCKVLTFRDSKTVESTSKMYQYPIVTDLDVSNTKISFNHPTFEAGDKKLSLNQLKSNVTALALKEAKADVMVEPRFTVVKKGWWIFGKNISISVDGYPAKYKNFRNVTDKDVDFFIHLGTLKDNKLLSLDILNPKKILKK